MIRVAILYIAIGEYIAFWPEFYRTFQEKFLVDCEKEYFVFTDSDDVMCAGDDCVHVVKEKDYGWPGNTLYRFSMFLRVEEELESFDYVIFINSNFVCNEVVTSEDFLPLENELLAMRFPSWENIRDSYRFPYERRRASTACIPYLSFEGQYYFAGGVQGGTAKAFLAACRHMEKNIKTDEENGITALRNDESHWNRYLLDHPDFRHLSPSFAYPEGWNLPFRKRLIVLEKSNYINLPQKNDDNWRPQFSRRQLIVLKTFERLKRLVMPKWEQCEDQLSPEELNNVT